MNVWVTFTYVLDVLAVTSKELQLLCVGTGYSLKDLPVGMDNRDSWLSLQDMDTASRVQILDETDCISHSTNTLGEGMNPIILPPAMGK